MKAGNPSEAIQAFEEARASYTGDCFADPYEEWASGQRVALQDMWLTLLSQSGTFYCREQKWEAAITCYRELLSGDCYREDIYR